MLIAIKAIKQLFLLCCLFTLHTLSGVECFFIPPKDWLPADTKDLSTRVKFSFIEKRSHGFCPSINLATEKVNVSLDEYLKIIQEIHQDNPKNRWRDLGKIQTKAGEAHLTEIDTHTKWGNVRLLQMIFLKDQKVYVLTGGVLKEEFARYGFVFQKALQSFTLADDLFACIESKDKRESLEKKFHEAVFSWKKKPSSLRSLQETLTLNHSELGLYWQYLVLKSAREKIDELAKDDKTSREHPDNL